METQIPIISSEKRSRFAITFILISVSLSVVMLPVGYFGVLLRDGTMSSFDHDIVNVYIVMANLLSVAFLVMFLASAICFIMWFWKAYGNLKELGCWTLSARSWTIGCWLIPLANLYLPYMYMREMFEGINAILKDKDELNMKWASTQMVLIWWLVFVSMIFLNQLTRQLDIFLFRNHTAYLAVLITTIVLWIVSGILAVKMIRSYVSAEKELMVLSRKEDSTQTDQIFI